MADERGAKLRRLERFRRAAPHLSQNALSAVLKEVKESGLPELTNRNAILEARNSTCNTQTEFGPLHQELDLTPVSGTRPIKLCFIHPLAFLAVLCSTCQCFSVYMESAVAAVPSSYERPWDVIFYSDKVSGPWPLQTHMPLPRQWHSPQHRYMANVSVARSWPRCRVAMCHSFPLAMAMASLAISR